MPRRTPRHSFVASLAPNDRFGKQSIAGAATRLTERKLRALDKRSREFIHRQKNGIYDPITFYHVVETLLNIVPGQDWTASQLAEYLNEQKPFLHWESVTLGRVLNDIVSCLTEANGLEHAGISATRDWSGRYYETSDDVEGQVALMNLLDDLAIQCEAVVRAESLGERVTRLSSPLNECASVMDPVARRVA